MPFASPDTSGPNDHWGAVFSLPRIRVVVDNDFAGDPDDLFQLVHHLLSPSVDIRFIIGSRLAEGDPFARGEAETAAKAARVAGDVLALMGLAGTCPVYRSSEEGMPDPQTPCDSDAVRALIREAMRDDTDAPLVIACGAGLTTVASAYLIEPRIAERLTVVWIGGPEYEDLGLPPPGLGPVEYNLNIDIPAGRRVFDSALPLWQVPRDVYRQCLFSYAELSARIRPLGELGEYLFRSVESLMIRLGDHERRSGEAYVLGDSPLVLLTALTSTFESDAASSTYVLRPAPYLTAAGTYEPNPEGREIRVYTRVDGRLMFDDLVAKLMMASG